MFKFKENQKGMVVIFLFIAIPIMFFWNIISSNIMLYQGDGAGYLATKELLKHILFNGEYPIWNRFNASGTPFAADVQNAVFYPFNLLTMIFPVNVGFELYFTLHLSLAAIGMYFYLKNITKSLPISFIGGLTLMFSNILVIRFNHINIMACIAWIPFMLLITDKLIEKRKTKYAILLGCLMAVQFLAGFPQISIYSDVFIFVYYLIFSLKNKREFKKIGKEALVFIGCYFGLIAVQIIPLAQLILFSQRGEISYNMFVSYSQSWRMLIQMIFPAFWGAGSSNLNIAVEFPSDIYIGIIPLILCIYGIRFHFKDFRVKVYLFAMIISYLYASCGEFTFLGKILYNIPIMNSFRVPCRIIFLVVINGLLLTFYSLYLLIKNNDFKNYLKTSIILLLLSCGSVLLISFMSSPIFNIFNDTYKDYYKNLNLYMPTLLLLLFNICIVYFVTIYHKLDFKHYATNLLCVLIGLATVFDVYYLNTDSWTDGYRINQLKNNPTEDEYSSELGEFLGSLQDKDKYRVIVDFIDFIEYNSLPSDTTGNNNIFHQYMSLQSFVTFQNLNYNAFCKTDNPKFLTSELLLSEINPSIISSLSTKYIVKKSTDPILSYRKIIAENQIYVEPEVVEKVCDKDSMITHNVPIKSKRIRHI